MFRLGQLHQSHSQERAYRQIEAALPLFSRKALDGFVLRLLLERTEIVVQRNERHRRIDDLHTLSVVRFETSTQTFVSRQQAREAFLQCFCVQLTSQAQLGTHVIREAY
jgi:hypothetical protein